MALDQPPHHVGLARRAGTPSRSPGVCLTAISAVDDLAALHQKPVHRLVDAVDLLAQVGERVAFRAGFRHGVSALIGGPGR